MDVASLSADEHDVMTEGDVDSALAMLLSSAADVDGGEGAVRTCIATICKLLGNLLASTGEEKFRSIRMGNAGTCLSVCPLSFNLLYFVCNATRLTTVVLHQHI